MAERNKDRPKSTEAGKGVSDEDRGGALKAGLFFAAAIAVILLLKMMLGY